MMFELGVTLISALAVSSTTALEISCDMDHCISRYGEFHGCKGQSPWTECLLFNSQSTCQIQANVKNLVKYCFDNATFVGNYSNHECSIKLENSNLTEEDSADWTCITTFKSEGSEDCQDWKTFGVEDSEDCQDWKTFGVIISKTSVADANKIHASGHVVDSQEAEFIYGVEGTVNADKPTANPANKQQL